MSERVTRAAVAYYRWNVRAFQSVKANVGYWIFLLSMVYLLVSWIRS